MSLQSSFEDFAYGLIDKGLVPDAIIRIAVRYLCRNRLRELRATYGNTLEQQTNAKNAFISALRSPYREIAEQQVRANEQHYEVPPAFLANTCMGPLAKYSCCLFENGKERIAQAEEEMMDLYCERARMRDGQDVLDLGCGWGSLTLYLAKKFPNSRIVGLSNSNNQREFILGKTKEEDLSNIEIITGDVNTFDFKDGRKFDRILSIEMFEHMKNYERLLRKVSTWLRPKSEYKLKIDDTLSLELDFDPEIEESDALLFVHLFCHRSFPYHFVHDDGWMARTFFSGGTMPSFDLLTYFQSDVSLIRSWYVNGKNYQKTSNEWLRLQDRNTKEGIAVLERDAQSKGLPAEEGRKAFYRFRTFYMAVAELFGLNDGEEWGVGHYLFRRKD